MSAALGLTVATFFASINLPAVVAPFLIGVGAVVALLDLAR